MPKAPVWQDWPSFVAPDIEAYVQLVSVRDTPLLKRLREETHAKFGGKAIMQVSPEEGQFLGFLIQAIGARNCIEIGTFTGYSSLSVALALPKDGRLICCDISAEWTSVAQRYWREAGVADKIELRIAPANETLDKLLAEGRAGGFDYIFIDGDKTGYDGYYERALKLVRTGGLIVIDNTLHAGRVLDASPDNPGTVSMQALNRKLHADTRVSLSMLPFRDGITLACKR